MCRSEKGEKSIWKEDLYMSISREWTFRFTEIFMAV